MTRARDLANILQNVTPPQTGLVGLSDTQTVTNKTIVDYTESSYTMTGTEVDPTQGSIQILVLSGPVTLTETLVSGQTVTLLCEGLDTYTTIWPTLTWVTGSGNTEPTWTAKDVVVLWKVSSTLYASYAGSYA